MISEPDALLRSLFEAALVAVDPAAGVARHLPPPPKGRTIVVGAGKAAAAMARAVEDNWPGPLEGVQNGLVDLCEGEGVGHGLRLC